MDHVTSRFADSLRGAERPRGTPSRSHAHAVIHTRTQSDIWSRRVYTCVHMSSHKAVATYSRASRVPDGRSARSWSYSASSVRKCSWKDFLLSGLERNVSGDSAMASADRARGKLLSLPRVKNKFIATLDCVAIFGTRSTERPIGWLVHRINSASGLENTSVAKGNRMISRCNPQVTILTLKRRISI